MPREGYPAICCIIDVCPFNGKTGVGFIHDGQITVDGGKGIESEKRMTMSEVILLESPQAKVIALSGPIHAEEVAKDLPTTIVTAHT